MIFTSLKKKLHFFLPVSLDAKREAIRDRCRGHHKPLCDEIHLSETSQWLIRAQDVTLDGGVSRGYSASSISSVGYRGWQPSYPETTGYIIPTLLELSGLTADPSYARRALRMADWETAIQLPSGAVMGSVVTAQPIPAVFNTGQVIFGWLAAYTRSKSQTFLDAARRGAEYLLAVQEPDGSWHKGNSRYALAASTVYNTRTAWALIELGLATDEARYINAGRRNIDYALTKQHPNGWYGDNCLTDPQNPLLHTIAYATRGVLESGIRLNDERYVKAASKALEALIMCQQPDGSIPGRLSPDWSSREKWCCVTGVAQVAVSWLRIHALTGEQRYKDSARAAIDFVKHTQNLQHPDEGIRGGVKGSFPFDGPYGQYEMLNWAAKFFCDALMMINDRELAARGIKG